MPNGNPLNYGSDSLVLALMGLCSFDLALMGLTEIRFRHYSPMSHGCEVNEERIDDSEGDDVNSEVELDRREQEKGHSVENAATVSCG